ncbi:hypothetical protein LZZ85_26435 [Terrimonas sp. NA20]|uniref:Secretion system C-terminal sorting domain-containing protein n=1 Tax=Terrimonas ginsenosidimutans TaxID=2908004 RepID=A0ABS9L075_9BACT|nr:hypothetical protein [Terrimonas ginsenosidimutans]MCG2617867.1 hypothetical protein [Terrimonas ginsenosidimutans]
MLTLIKKILPIAALLLSAVAIEAQPVLAAATEKNKPAKPYRILTSGRQITIKSNKDIKSIMVWSANGNRILEQKEINAGSYNFRLTVNDKVLFIRIQLNDGKVYSERVGIH